jgi:hypothetical protein
MNHKISAYGYLFNARKYGFDTEKTVANFCAFFDEVICATVSSEDDTREVLAELEVNYPNFRVIDSKIKIAGNNRFDGQLKTLAMNECKNTLRCIVDFDESFPLSNRDKWDKYCELLINNKFIDGFLIPSVDLHGSEDKIRSDVAVGQKFRLHKDTVHERGVPFFAQRNSGLFDTSRSDSTEPLNGNGELSNFQAIVPQIILNPMFVDQLVDFPYSLHYGNVDLERRAKIGKDFWKERWEERSGREENVATSKNQLDSAPVIFHNLPLQ